MKHKRILPALGLCCLLLSGCSGGRGNTFLARFREVEKLQVIETLGFDGENGRVTLSAASGRGQTDGGAPLLAAEGAGVQRAARKLQDWSTQEELFLSHVRYAVAGEEAAAAGLSELLDSFERDPHTRLDVPLFIVRGGTALELVTGFGGESFEITEALSSIQRDAEQFGAPRCFTMLEVARRLAGGEAALCCALERRETGGNVFPQEEGHIALECGYAVLRDDGTLAGFLDEEAARGTNLLLGEPGADSAVLSVDGQSYTAELTGGGTEISPVADGDGGVTLRIRMDYRAGLTDAPGGDPPGEATLDTLDALLTRWLLDRAQAALSAARALDADFLLLNRQAPALYAGTGRSRLPAGLRWELTATGRVERGYGLSGLVAAPGGEGAPHA